MNDVAARAALQGVPAVMPDLATVIQHLRGLTGPLQATPAEPFTPSLLAAPNRELRTTSEKHDSPPNHVPAVAPASAPARPPTDSHPPACAAVRFQPPVPAQQTAPPPRRRLSTHPPLYDPALYENAAQAALEPPQATAMDVDPPTRPTGPAREARRAAGTANLPVPAAATATAAALPPSLRRLPTAPTLNQTLRKV